MRMKDGTEQAPREGRGPGQGSALVMAIFVLFLVTSLGVALLFLSRNEVRLSQADVRGKTVYYYSEAGLEDARTAVWQADLVSTLILSLDDELAAAAGSNNVIDFDLANVAPIFDANGNLTGVTGVGDDVPPALLTNFDGGRYIAYLTNDPVDGRTNLTDSNDRVMLTGIGAGPDRSVEVVQAIVERKTLYPQLPAAITILGEQNCGADCAFFEGGTSTPKTYTGDDTGPHCSGGVPGFNVPVIGVIGNSSVTTSGTGVHKPNSYQSGGATGTATIADLISAGTLDPMWQNCNDIVDFAALVRSMADVVGNSSTPYSDLGTPGDGKVVFIEGDYDVNGGFSGQGVLFVTGYLEFSGNADWEGPIFVIGEGDFERDGAGNGVISGGILVADVSGPDRVLFTGDDCAGQDGVNGTADDGIAQSTFNVSGGGTGTTGYCSAALKDWQAQRPLDIVSFIQR
jgi:hypothetical protein